MALSSVTSAAGTNTPTTSEPTEKSALDKDAFLKLLVAQLSHQDPLQPTEGTEFVAQLSQFAMVEQSIAQSAKLDVLSAQMTGLASNEAAGLVGKDVTVRGNGIAFDGVTATGSSVNLDAAAAKVTVRIQDASGKTVRTLELGPRGAGAVPITWDGKDDAGQPVAKGTYAIKVDAQTADGKSVNTSQDVSGKVTKVSFEKGYPELLLDSGVTAPISELVSVGGTVR
ncbi:MAG: flagellar hook assembly protein FlgD [Labilithrix sp.]|nr:flagellar hook assembly protein FlgD [Labilithrix sp.]MCW5832776.1 flagellar hook assembly protein FlgD [Labilithrix sp.]